MRLYVGTHRIVSYNIHMKLDKLLEELLNLPKTLEEAVTYVKKNPVMKTTIDEMAFKQTVINLLIAAGLVSENDFNASVEYFKNQLYEEFGKELLEEANSLADQDECSSDDTTADNEANEPEGTGVWININGGLPKA